MRLYLLKRQGGVDYDEVASFVIAATSEGLAMLLASAEAGDEGKDFWLDSRNYLLTCIGSAIVPQGIVLRSFKAG